MSERPSDISVEAWGRAVGMVAGLGLGGDVATQTIARQIDLAIAVERERCALVAENWLTEWAGDLQDTRDSYIVARKSGRHNGRRISEDMAATFASQFRERSDAVFGCSEQVAAAIRKVTA